MATSPHDIAHTPEGKPVRKMNMGGIPASHSMTPKEDRPGGERKIVPFPERGLIQDWTPAALIEDKGP